MENPVSKLGEYIDQALARKKWRVREAERHTGVSRNTYARLATEPDFRPDMETMIKLARAFDEPLWRILEMAGYDMGMGTATHDQMLRLGSLLARQPWLRRAVDHLERIDEGQMEALLVYLETLERLRRP